MALRVPRVSLSTPSSPEVRARRSGPSHEPLPATILNTLTLEDAGAPPEAASASHGKAEAAAAFGDFPRSKSGPYDRKAEKKAFTSVPTTFVIPSSFFKEFSDVVIPSPGPASSAVENAPQRPANPPGAQSDASILAWRRMMNSPLGTFLTGVRNKYPWVQLVGHKGNFIAGEAGTICKKASDMERAALEALMSDPLKPFVPLYYKELQLSEEPGAPLEPYLEIQDLLGNFQNPSVMDIKMGVRTFLESEVTKSSKRMDLLEKMAELDPDEPTEEERKSGITKLRYMSFRERLSSTKTLCFRVEGIKLANQELRSDFKMAKTRDDVQVILQSFLPPPTDSMGRVIRERIVQRLVDLHATAEQSRFFWHHELIGSSLLFVYDTSGRVGVWMIDFGKTSPTEAPITHREPWVLGNREDGYLVGLENLIDMFH